MHASLPSHGSATLIPISSKFLMQELMSILIFSFTNKLEQPSIAFVSSCLWLVLFQEESNKTQPKLDLFWPLSLLLLLEQCPAGFCCCSLSLSSLPCSAKEDGFLFSIAPCWLWFWRVPVVVALLCDGCVCVMHVPPILSTILMRLLQTVPPGIFTMKQTHLSPSSPTISLSFEPLVCSCYHILPFYQWSVCLSALWELPPKGWPQRKCLQLPPSITCPLHIDPLMSFPQTLPLYTLHKVILSTISECLASPIHTLHLP